MKEFILRKCQVCGCPRNEFVDGQEYILRCDCDWLAVSRERLLKTVGPDFLNKNMGDYSPYLFKDRGLTPFGNLIKIQKAVAIHRIYDFCFKSINNLFSIYRSIDYSKNLFIRGPYNSGRGLLISSIKTMAASKQISATPKTDEWAIFKSTLVEADSFGAAGQAAKGLIAEDYRHVQLMTLQNLRAEGSFMTLDEKFLPRRFKGATSFDDLLVRRSTSKGCMVFSSLDFMGQIGTTLGDALPEVFMSDKTALIILLHPNEATSLLRGLNDRCKEVINSTNVLLGGEVETDEKAGHASRLNSDENLANFKDFLYLRDSFSEIPAAHGDSVVNFSGIGAKIERKNNKLHPKIQQCIKEFEEDKKAGGGSFIQARDAALILAIKKSKDIASKLSIKESLEIGKMMSMACNPEKTEAILTKALALRDEMAGKVKGKNE